VQGVHIPGTPERAGQAIIVEKLSKLYEAKGGGGSPCTSSRTRARWSPRALKPGFVYMQVRTAYCVCTV